MKQKLINRVLQDGFATTNRFEYKLGSGVILKRPIGTETWVTARVLEKGGDHE